MSKYYYKELLGAESNEENPSLTLHREDGPAIISGNNILEKHYWYKDGKPFRNDGLSNEETFFKGTLQIQRWIKDHKDNLHRENGPASIGYDFSTNKKSSEYYYLNGKQHRDDGPAVINYSKENKIIKKEFWNNGLPAPAPQPYIQCYDSEDFSLKSESYYYPENNNSEHSSIIDISYNSYYWSSFNGGSHHSFFIEYENNHLISAAVSSKVWLKEWNKKDSDMFPSEINYHQNGSIAAKRWYKENKLHSYKDEPSEVYFEEDLSPILEQWHKNGALHREKEPAYIFYQSKENLNLYQKDKKKNIYSTIKYFIDGKKHRLDGPAYLDYQEDGSLFEEGYYLDGRYHRVDGPSFIRYHDNGAINIIEFCVNGKRHASDKAARTVYDNHGKIEEEQWFLEGKNIDQ